MLWFYLDSINFIYVNNACFAKDCAHYPSANYGTYNAALVIHRASRPDNNSNGLQAAAGTNEQRLAEDHIESSTRNSTLDCIYKKYMYILKGYTVLNTDTTQT